MFVLDPKAEDKSQILRWQQTIPVDGINDNINYIKEKQVYVVAGIHKASDHIGFTEAYKKEGKRPENVSFWAVVNEIDEKTLKSKSVLSKEHAISGCSSAYPLPDGGYILGSWGDRAPVICRKK